ncbi:acetyl-CoA synthetase-like protein [Lentinus tigrinus ALCF2SS1-7]|uniref:Acetyl-CoA synthetase-like protein n=1 Tax=Lentinus tigrinus ALCF2SS1-6 TaxID=1328759 RepID=A0A5C2S5C4_9APHY|nr:acetyl-CoA synthetase-like protein [Lentinus tigrinus ALCF2SS1-6]RPD73007.1 acetyl-CoA synthetase-like protein [Lentinus tigrinus ALCF2SS1-7]
MPLDHAGLPAHVKTDFHSPEELRERTDITVAQLYEWHAKANPDYPLFIYQDGDKLEYITHSTAYRAIDRVARYVASIAGTGGSEASSNQPVVALFANTDTITYFCTALGVMRAGCTLFLVSTRNTPAALVDMFQRTGTAHVLTSSDPFMRQVGEEALKTLDASGVHISDHPAPVFEDIFPETLDPTSPFAVDVEIPQKFDVYAHGIILHSSGSTGHPKPIPWSHKKLFSWGQEPLRCGVDVKGALMGCQGTPMFHGLGMFMFASSGFMGFIIAAFKPASPPKVPTPDAVWEGLVASGADFSWCVPSFIEEWARDPEKVSLMKRMRGVLFGGAALNTEVGNSLASQGVSLYTVYGATEVGLINTFARPNPGMDWEYWTVTVSIECVFRPVDDGTYEVVVLSPRDLPLPKPNTKIGDRDAYATSDLVIPHSTKSGLWKIVGRADEQIILSNGEKTNPVPLEKIINGDPHVKCSVMFGRGKFQNGVLIEPTEDYVFDPKDLTKLEAYRNKIWPTIERVNEYAPQHSRIFKEMIIVTSPSKPFQFTVKGLPRRNIILQEYHDEIEALYKEVEESTQSDFAPPAQWDESTTLEFVRTVVQSTLHRSLSDDEDIFRNGGDSLQATYIRNTLLRAIRETDKDAAKRLPMNLVFAHPTIASLAHAALAALRVGSIDGHTIHRSHTPADLWTYVEKHSANFPARPQKLSDRPEGKDVVLITGTTGGFGCDTLEHLLRDDSVGKVYAFNRKNARAMERQRAQFRARGLDETLLHSPKFRMVEAVLHEPGFALEPSLLSEIQHSVTHIMHNAWKVDFNLSISSFDVDIQGTRNLVDLALGSPYTVPPTIIFVSSVGIFTNCKLPAPVPEVPIHDPESPYGIGYSEAKWVAEHILQNASKERGLHTIVMRLGQVAGDRLGYWNEREWFPALVKSALFQKCLPDLEGTVTWFPAYEAAKAFAEMPRSRERFLHLVHPRPTPWHDIMAPIAKSLGVPLVPYEQWLAALKTSVEHGSAAEVEAMKLNPALRLLPFYESQGRTMSRDREPMGLVYLDTTKAQAASPALADLPALDAERAQRWVEAWKKAGFI